MISILSSLLASDAVDLLWQTADAAEIVFDGELYLLIREGNGLGPGSIWIQRSDRQGPRLSLEEWQALALGTGQDDEQARLRAAMVSTGASLN